jgi:hypothetical protein
MTPSKVLGIMQPYFFPFFEQFRLLAACDEWVIFDTPQYSRKSWINRNRVLNREKGTTYVSVPVRHAGYSIPIKEAEIDHAQDWQGAVLNRLKVYKKRAPHYDWVTGWVSEIIHGPHTTLGGLNAEIVRNVARTLDIPTPIALASELPFALPKEAAPDEWALHISKGLNATEYRNAAGGKSFFDGSKYAAAGITLSFHEHAPRIYQTGDLEFVTDLSIIDWLMWNDINTLKEWLK